MNGRQADCHRLESCRSDCRKTASPSLVRLLSMVALVVLVGCGPKAVDGDKQPVPSNEQASQDEASRIQPVDLGAAKPAHVIQGVYLAGQPTAEEMPQLQSKGIKTVVTLRPDSETNWDERTAVESAGMSFESIPFRGEDQLTDEVFDQVRAVLKNKQKQPVLLHCGGADRVGAVWLAHRVLDDGLGIEAALEEAKTAGLRTEAYQTKAVDYVKRHAEDPSVNNPSEKSEE